VSAKETPFTIVAPCSTSNLGAGFDALGLALGGPRLSIRWSPASGPLRIAALSGEGASSLSRGADNRVLVAARAAAETLGASFDSFTGELSIDNTVPLARGLGSSAAAAVGGAILAEALASRAPEAPPGHALRTNDWHANDLRPNDSASLPRFDGARVLATALSLEGHPDNVIACLRGGAQVAVLDTQGRVQACPLRVEGAAQSPLRAAVFIPDQELQTSAARAVIPRTVPLADAVFNLGRSALFVAALAAGRFELLGEAMSDRLHQPARASLMPWLPQLIEAAKAAGAYGAALSGAGTTVFSLAPAGSAEQVVEALRSRAAALGVPGRALSATAFAPGARIEG